MRSDTGGNSSTKFTREMFDPSLNVIFEKIRTDGIGEKMMMSSLLVRFPHSFQVPRSDTTAVLGREDPEMPQFFSKMFETKSKRHKHGRCQF